MKLHEDKNAFRLLLESIHKRTGYRPDVLEKDYYVLRECDRIDFQAAAKSLMAIQEKLLKNAAWTGCEKISENLG